MTNEIKELYIYEPSYPFLSFVSEWLNVSSSNFLTITANNDNDYDINIDWASDTNYNIINTETQNIYGGDSVTLFRPVLNRFVRISITNIAVAPNFLQLQGFHYTTSDMGLTYLENGSGRADILRAPNILRSLTSYDNSILFTTTDNNISLSVNNFFQLTSYSYSEEIGVIKNIKGGNFICANPTTIIIEGTNTASSVLASSSTTLKNATYCFLSACTGGGFLSPSGSTQLWRDAILACANSSISTSNYSTDICAIIASSASNLTGVDRSISNSAIISAWNCYMNGALRSTIMSSYNSYITNTHSGVGCNVIMGANNSSITGNQPHNIVFGNACHSSGGYAYSINLSSTNTLTTTTAKRFTLKAPGGVYLYTNDGETTGMFLATSSSSWSAVSLRSAKDNIVELDYDDVLNKFDEMGIYSYNYKDCHHCRKSIGPMADGIDGFYSTVFPVEMIQINKKDIDNNDILDESGEPITETIPAKDIESIEINDRIGVLEACLKGLLNRVKQQEERIKELESKVI